MSAGPFLIMFLSVQLKGGEWRRKQEHGGHMDLQLEVQVLGLTLLLGPHLLGWGHFSPGLCLIQTMRFLCSITSKTLSCSDGQLVCNWEIIHHFSLGTLWRVDELPTHFSPTHVTIWPAQMHSVTTQTLRLSLGLPGCLCLTYDNNNNYCRYYYFG